MTRKIAVHMTVDSPETLEKMRRRMVAALEGMFSSLEISRIDPEAGDLVGKGAAGPVQSPAAAG